MDQLRKCVLCRLHCNENARPNRKSCSTTNSSYSSYRDKMFDSSGSSVHAFERAIVSSVCFELESSPGSMGSNFVMKKFQASCPTLSYNHYYHSKSKKLITKIQKSFKFDIIFHFFNVVHFSFFYVKKMNPRWNINSEVVISELEQ